MDALLWSKVDSSSFTLSKASTTFVLVSLSFCHCLLYTSIKAARTERKESRKKVSDEMYISPRYLANIETKGQQPSLQIFYELVTRYDISVVQFFFPDKSAEKDTQRRPVSYTHLTSCFLRQTYLHIRKQRQ